MKITLDTSRRTFNIGALRFTIAGFDGCVPRSKCIKTVPWMYWHRYGYDNNPSEKVCFVFSSYPLWINYDKRNNK